jgi:transposase-like protein
MGTKKVNLRNVKRYSEEFKRALVNEYESGKFSVMELSRLYQVSFQGLYSWIYRYSTYNKKKVTIVEMSESSTKKLKDMELRIKELERIVGQKQIKIDYLEKMIELASEQYQVDIKKNFNTPQSSVSGPTEKR